MYSRVDKEQETVEIGQGVIETASPTPPPTASPLLQILVLCCLGLASLIPRIILANQLDLVTDEIIYIIAGKSYIPLLSHITTSIGSNGWQVNYEHPPLVKLLIGLSILANNRAGHPFNELQTARIPSIITGTTLIIAIYWLGRKPFGQVVAFLAALSLAFSPWLVYFSSIAYLDMTMTMFITIAYLLTWHATHHPWLYPCIALCIGMGIDSKYTASLIVPGILLFTAYYFFVLRLYLPASQRPSIPWLWWLMAAICMPLCFLALDPAIWPNPLDMLMHSVLFEWNHSVGGHLTFLAGSSNLHAPRWTVFYIIINKVSAFVTVPAVIFAVIAPIQLIRFHLPVGRGHRKSQYRLNNEGVLSGYAIRQGRRKAPTPPPPFPRPLRLPRMLPLPILDHRKARMGFIRRGRGGLDGVGGPCADPGSPSTPYSPEIAPPISSFMVPRRGMRYLSGIDPCGSDEARTLAFLFIWLLTTFAMFSLLNIVVGTHYLLPLAPPTV